MNTHLIRMISFFAFCTLSHNLFAMHDENTLQDIRLRIFEASQNTITLKNYGKKKFGDLKMEGDMRKEQWKCGRVAFIIDGIFTDDNSKVKLKYITPGSFWGGVPFYLGSIATKDATIKLESCEAAQLYNWLDMCKKYSVTHEQK